MGFGDCAKSPIPNPHYITKLLLSYLVYLLYLLST
jgi:hypothetical protein